jgi:hypothetical protein
MLLQKSSFHPKPSAGRATFCLVLATSFSQSGSIQMEFSPNFFFTAGSSLQFDKTIPVEPHTEKFRPRQKRTAPPFAFLDHLL